MTKKSDSPTNTLDELNDHLARFFRHADTLLAEWKSYGERVRGEIDGEVAKLQGTVSAAVQEAGREATRSLDGQVETSLGDGLTRLRGEVDRLTRVASEASARLAGAETAGAGLGGGTALGGGGGRSTLALVALVSANVMLAVLIVLSARSCADEESAGTERPGIEVGGGTDDEGEGEGAGEGEGEGEGVSVIDVDAGVVGAGDAGVSAMAPVCEALAKGYDVEAAKKLIEAAAVEHCGEAGAGIAETVNGRLVVPKAPGTGTGTNRGKGKGKGKGRGGR